MVHLSPIAFFRMCDNLDFLSGEIRRAEDHFRAVHDRATKVQNQQKRKYLFGSLLGLVRQSTMSRLEALTSSSLCFQGIVSYARQKYQMALDQFTKAVECHPSCSASVRLAIACCCFRLEQYERARLAIDRALTMEVCHNSGYVFGIKALLLLHCCCSRRIQMCC